MRIDTFLFDLDGTLIDSADDIALSLRLTLKDLGKEDLMPQDVRKLIGGGVRALLEKVLGEEFRKEHVSLFREHYLRNAVVHTELFPGVEEVLHELRAKGKTLVVITNKMKLLTDKILEELGIDELFDLVVGGDSFPEKKPSPLPVLKSLEITGGKPERSIIVGDTAADIEAGRSAGTKTALAAWGYVKLNSLQPDYVFESPKDILLFSD